MTSGRKLQFSSYLTPQNPSKIVKKFSIMIKKKNASKNPMKLNYLPKE
jgi:hypothetical protein